MDRDEVLDIIFDVLEYNYPRRYPVWSKNFKQSSYSKWGVLEAVRYIITHPDMSPLACLYELRDKFNSYSCENGENSIMFSCAVDAIDDLIFNVYGDSEHNRDDYFY